MKTAGVRMGTRKEANELHFFAEVLIDFLAQTTKDPEVAANILGYTIAKLEVDHAPTPHDCDKNVDALCDGIKANVAILQRIKSGGNA